MKIGETISIALNESDIKDFFYYWEGESYPNDFKIYYSSKDESMILEFWDESRHGVYEINTSIKETIGTGIFIVSIKAKINWFEFLEGDPDETILGFSVKDIYFEPDKSFFPRSIKTEIDKIWRIESHGTFRFSFNLLKANDISITYRKERDYTEKEKMRFDSSRESRENYLKWKEKNKPWK